MLFVEFRYLSRRQLQVLMIAVCTLALLLGCGRSRPKTLDELYEEQRQLPAVFLTTETHKRVVAPGDSGVFVDSESGELCWPASACGNPACPGRESPDVPFLFVAPDPAIVVNADGSIGYDASRSGKVDNYYGNCPQCLTIRNLDSETDEDRLKYANFVRPYVLPATAKRQKELEAERQQREAELHERMQRTD